MTASRLFAFFHQCGTSLSLLWRRCNARNTSSQASATSSSDSVLPLSTHCFPAACAEFAVLWLCWVRSCCAVTSCAVLALLAINDSIICSIEKNLCMFFIRVARDNVYILNGKNKYCISTWHITRNMTCGLPPTCKIWVLSSHWFSWKSCLYLHPLLMQHSVYICACSLHLWLVRDPGLFVSFLTLSFNLLCFSHTPFLINLNLLSCMSLYE